MLRITCLSERLKPKADAGALFHLLALSNFHVELGQSILFRLTLSVSTSWSLQLAPNEFRPAG